MTIKWTNLVFPSDLPSSEKTFAYQLYSFLTTFEAQTQEERQQPQLVNGDITIGVGFDLEVGGVAVERAQNKDLCRWSPVKSKIFGE